jgi:hypothetical protein
MRELKTGEVAHLAEDDDHGDAGREADGHRIGDVFDKGADAQIPDRDQDHASDQGRQHQAVIAFALDDQRHQHDESACGPADLEAAAAEQRDQEAADDGGIEPAFRADAGRHRDCHRQRQGHDRDGEAGDRVGAQVVEAVALAQDRYELRREELAEGRLRCGYR